VPLLSCLAWIGIVTNPTGEIVTWRGVDKLGTGIFPPPTAERPASHKETAALELWKSVLEAGGANVITTDNVTSMRFAKVCEKSVSVSQLCQQHSDMACLQCHR